MDTEASINLTGVLKKILFTNEDNNYYIAVLDNDQKICGQYFDAPLEKLVGEEVLISGSWNVHKKYGAQFVFTSVQVKEAEIYFFLTKIVKGISKKYFFKYTSKIYRCFSIHH